MWSVGITLSGNEVGYSEAELALADPRRPIGALRRLQQD
jgi:hypothetical protein